MLLEPSSQKKNILIKQEQKISTLLRDTAAHERCS